MIGGLSQCVRHQVDPAIAQLRQGLGPAFIARMEMKAIGGWPWLQDTRHPPLLSISRSTKNVIGTFITLSELSAHQHSVPELQLLQMPFDAGKVFVPKFSLQHCEECGEALRIKLLGRLMANAPQRFKRAQKD